MIGWPCMADKATPGLRPFADEEGMIRRSISLKFESEGWHEKYKDGVK